MTPPLDLDAQPQRRNNHRRLLNAIRFWTSLIGMTLPIILGITVRMFNANCFPVSADGILWSGLITSAMVFILLAVSYE